MEDDEGRMVLEIPDTFGKRIPGVYDIEAIAALLEGDGTRPKSTLTADTLKKINGVIATYAKQFRSTDNE